MKPDFGRVAESYRKYRIGYSPQTIEALRRESSGNILDVGVGTGLLTELLRPYARRVVGVDISWAMISKTPPPVVQAAAEYLPVRSRSFDMVTCAEAFHWFDRFRAITEFQRVLREGGFIALMWKSPADGEPYRALSHDVFREITGSPYKSAMPPGMLEEMAVGWRSERFEWEVEWTVDQYVGCLSSWEAMRQQLGPLLEVFLASFRSRLSQYVGGRPFRERIVDQVFTRRV